MSANTLIIDPETYKAEFPTLAEGYNRPKKTPVVASQECVVSSDAKPQNAVDQCRYGRYCGNRRCEFEHPHHHANVLCNRKTCVDPSCTYAHSTYLPDEENLCKPAHNANSSTKKVLCKYGRQCGAYYCTYEHPEHHLDVLCTHEKCYNQVCPFKHDLAFYASFKKSDKMCHYKEKCKIRERCPFTHPISCNSIYDKTDVKWSSQPTSYATTAPTRINKFDALSEFDE